MSINLKANPDGISGAIQINGVDAVPFNAGGIPSKLQSVTATQSGGALTVTLNPTTLDFRSSTLTTGVPNTRSISSAISLVVPSGATLGSVTTVSARLMLIAIDNAGTVELAVVNIAGGNDLSETGLISTTTIDTASDSANVFYSTTARTNVPYRVVGAVDAVNTAGAWGNPTLVQGYGGQALASMSSLGCGQTWQNVTRNAGTTYYTGAKPIQFRCYMTSGATGAEIQVTVAGFSFGSLSYAAGQAALMCDIIIPPYTSYSYTTSLGSLGFKELR